MVVRPHFGFIDELPAPPALSVEVFRTNVEDRDVALRLTEEIRSIFPGSDVNFDLDDCDRILRVKGPGLLPGVIIEVLTERGFLCKELE